MEKINIAELLKDCPRGMELDCTMYDNCTFAGIEDVGYIDILVRTPSGIIRLTKEGCYTRHDDYAKCVIFPKGKTTWEGFQRPFKDGEIIATDLGSVFILKSCLEDQIHYHSYIGVTCCNEIQEKQIPFAYKHVCHLATEEEKEKLFRVIKENGYKWNEETKTLEELPKFKDGDVISNTSDSVCIFRGEGKIKGTVDFYCGINTDDSNELFIKDPTDPLEHFGDIIQYNFATEEEKQILFDSIKENGYRWNADTKTLEDFIEPIFKVGDRVKSKDGDKIGIITQVTDYFYTIKCKNYTHYEAIKKQDDWELVPDKFDITTLKPFDKVLVRNDDKHVWEIQFFERLNNILKDSFVCMGRERYHQCIPYEGNEHLHNTAKDCDEYFKTWK